MKRTALVLLTAIYLFSCVGMGINRFYCCGKLASVTLTYGAADNTGKETGNKYNCCKNERETFKVKDSHFSSVSFSLDHPVPAIVPAFIFNDERLISLLHAKIVYKSNAPPGSPAAPIYTLNCTYRI